MNIALIGYGKMGKAIEQIAINKGHKIVAIITTANNDELAAGNLNNADVAIEFTCVLGPIQKVEGGLLSHCLLLWRHHEATSSWPCTLHHPAPRSLGRIHGRHIETLMAGSKQQLALAGRRQMFRHTPSRVTIFYHYIIIYYCYYLLKRIYTLFIVNFLFRVLNGFVCIV